LKMIFPSELKVFQTICYFKHVHFQSWMFVEIFL